MTARGKNAQPIDPTRVRDLFFYDRDTGVLCWRKHTWRSNAQAGDAAGGVSRKKDGTPIAMTVGIGGRRYLVHRVIWVMVTGADIPINMEVDHINRDPTDNRWSNLRLATPSQNLFNTLRKRELPKGVYVGRGGRFRAQIKLDGARALSLGTYTTVEEASAAFAEAYHARAGRFARVVT